MPHLHPGYAPAGRPGGYDAPPITCERHGVYLCVECRVRLSWRPCTGCGCAIALDGPRGHDFRDTCHVCAAELERRAAVVFAEHGRPEEEPRGGTP